MAGGGTGRNSYINKTEKGLSTFLARGLRREEKGRVGGVSFGGAAAHNRYEEEWMVSGVH